MPIYRHSQHIKRFNLKANTWNIQYVTLELVIRVFDKIPQECFSYILGNRSALEWVIDQLVGRVVTVSVETVRLVEELAQAVTLEDWMERETTFL
jgi:predicted helicase